MPFGWRHCSELLRLLRVYHHHPGILPQGWQGHGAIFSTRATVADDVIVGLDALQTRGAANTGSCIRRCKACAVV